MNRCKKKLLFLVTLPPPMHGSNRINLMMVENPTLKEQIDTRVLSLNYARSIDEIGRFQLMKYVRLVQYLLHLIILLLSFRPDAVYFTPCITGGPFLRDLLFVEILKLFRVQRILHLHGKGIKARLSSIVMRVVYRWFFCNAHVVVLSPQLYSDIESVVSKDQVSYLANGVDINSKFLSGVSTHRVEGEFRFIFLSNLIPTKGPITLLEACRILKEKGYQFSTVFVGNPSQELTKEIFNSLIQEMSLSDCVYYLGPKYGAEKSAELAAADVMVFPTYKDCFPLVLLEGMAFGLPVISSFEGAIPDIVDEEKTGFLISDRDPEMLAEKMILLMESPDMVSELGKSGYQKFLNQYTHSSFNERASQLLSRLVNGDVKSEAHFVRAN